MECFDFVKSRFYAMMVTAAILFVLAVITVKHAVLPAFVLWGAAIAFGVFLVRRSFAAPEVPLFLLAAVIPFTAQFGERFLKSFGVHPVLLLAFFVFILWRRGAYSKGVRQWKWGPARLPVLLFLGWGGLSIVKDLYVGPGYLLAGFLSFLGSWLLIFFLFFLFYNAAEEPETLKSVLVVMAGSAFLAALLACYDYWSSGGERVYGIFAVKDPLVDPPNQLAAFFNSMIFLPAAVFLFCFQNPYGWAFGLSALVFLRGLMVVFSRGGYLAFAAGAYAFACFRSRILLLILLAGTAIVLIYPELLPPGVRWRLGNTLESKTVYDESGLHTVRQLDRSTADRLEIWKAGVRIIQEFPVFGVGYSRFPAKAQNYWYAGVPFQPHNAFLAVAAELGLPALVFFVWIHLVCFREAVLVFIRAKEPFNRALALGFIAAFFSILVSYCYISRTDRLHIVGYFWIYAALLMRLREVEHAL